MKKSACLLLALLAMLGLAPAAITSAAPSPDMFAYGMELNAGPEHSLCEIALPLALYQGVTRSDLGDVRIFNKAGQVVPSALLNSQNKNVRYMAASRPLPFFPLSGSASKPGGDLALSLKRDSMGTIMNLKLMDKALSDSGKKPTGYLIDATSQKQSIDSFILSWADSASDFLTQVVVEKSMDLEHWEAVTSAPVAQLNHEGRRLLRNILDFTPTTAKYYRLTWANEQTPLVISAITVQSHATNVVSNPQRNWYTAVASPATQKSYHYLIDLKGPLPVARVKIKLQDANAVASVSLSSGPTPEKAEKMHWRGLVYNLSMDGNTLAAPAVAVGPSQHRFWMLTVDQSESAFSQPPVLEFGWQPQRLLFMAQGEGPFVLAYGSTAVEPNPLQLGSLLERFKDEKGQAISPKVIIPGPQFSINEKGLLPGLGALPWRKYTLWFILGAGVLLIGWMSRKLYRQMGGKSAGE